jgi:IclR family transcriptional regulator, pca regulon regulatory protein
VTGSGPDSSAEQDGRLTTDLARNPYFVQSLERGLAVIRAFGPNGSHLTLSEVARITGLTRAAARRFLLTLVDLGYMHTDGRLFSLGPRILELGYSYLATLGFAEVAAPHMEELVASVRESSSAAVLDDDEIVYVVRVPTQRIMTVNIAVGTRFPAYPTSMGRVLLASLSADQLNRYLERLTPRPLTPKTVVDPDELRAIVQQVGAQGYAIVDQELEAGVRSVAAPIQDGKGAVVAAVNVSVHASRVTMESLRKTYLPQLLSTADRIRRDLAAIGGSATRLTAR